MNPEYLHQPLFYFFIFGIGACIGSFLNVCIYRIPLERSIVSPGSCCSACGAPIPGKYNVPILSWLLLRGRSACCSTKIDARYVIVEILTALVFTALWHDFPPAEFLAYAYFFSALLIASCIDIDHFIIPDRFTLGTCAVGLIASALVPSLHHKTGAYDGFREGLWGAFIGFATLLVVSKIGAKVFKKEAMGLGDVKFLAGMGAFLGWKATLFIIASSSFFGSIFGVFLILREQKSWGTRMPYGPFLAMAALLWIFAGSDWTDAYLDSWDKALAPIDLTAPPLPRP
jgi:leader peptidase (prepilin peptidase) / N-methyltransferase